MTDWRLVPATGFRVPEGTSLADVTADLTGLLGDADPVLREQTARAVLTTWISRGVYDDLLTGLGDGIATGLRVNHPAGDAVFRRASSALVLGTCIARDSASSLVPAGKVLEWGDHLATWLLAERDLRDHVPGKGSVAALSLGADALGHLVASPHVRRAELSALLAVLGERVRADSAPWLGDEADRLAAAAVRLLRRSALSLDEVEDWAAEIGRRALRQRRSPEPDPGARNADAFLRSLYLVLALGPKPPPIRADLVLTLVTFLRELHPGFLG